MHTECSSASASKAPQFLGQLWSPIACMQWLLLLLHLCQAAWRILLWLLSCSNSNLALASLWRCAARAAAAAGIQPQSCGRAGGGCCCCS